MFCSGKRVVGRLLCLFDDSFLCFLPFLNVRGGTSPLDKGFDKWAYSVRVRQCGRSQETFSLEQRSSLLSVFLILLRGGISIPRAPGIHGIDVPDFEQHAHQFHFLHALLWVNHREMDDI